MRDEERGRAFLSGRLAAGRPKEQPKKGDDTSWLGVSRSDRVGGDVRP
jgi:hypothetical protein